MTLREKLVIKGRDYLELVYKYTSDFPKHEIFGVTSQLRRASLSVLLNIVEGHSRYSIRKCDRELISYLTMSYGSSEECQELIRISNKLNYAKEEELNELQKRIIEISKLTRSLAKRISSKS